MSRIVSRRGRCYGVLVIASSRDGDDARQGVEFTQYRFSMSRIVSRRGRCYGVLVIASSRGGDDARQLIRYSLMVVRYSFSCVTHRLSQRTMLWCAGHRIVSKRRRCSTVNSLFVDGCSLFVLLCHASSLAEDDAMVRWSSHRPEAETMLDRVLHGRGILVKSISD